MYLLSSCSYQATKCKQTLIHIIQCEVSRQRLTLLIIHWRIDNLFAHANNGKLQTQNPHLILVLSLPMDQSFSPPHFCQKLNLILTNPSVCNFFYRKGSKTGQYRKKTDSMYNVKWQFLLWPRKGVWSHPACYVIKDAWQSFVA